MAYVRCCTSGANLQQSQAPVASATHSTAVANTDAAKTAYHLKQHDLLLLLLLLCPLFTPRQLSPTQPTE
jgi:hypothetical protein